MDYPAMTTTRRGTTFQASLQLVVTMWLSTLPIHAQQASGAPSIDEERIVKGMEDYGLSGRQKTYDALDGRGRPRGPRGTSMISRSQQ